MIEFRTQDETAKDGTVTTVCEVVFVAPDAVNATHRKFAEFNPVLAELLRDRFAEAVSKYLEILEGSHGIILQPSDSDWYGDSYMVVRMRELGIKEVPALSRILTDGGDLSMAFTTSPEIMTQLGGRKTAIESSFHLLVNASHCVFMRTEVPR